MSVSAETGATRPDRARSTRTLTVTGLNHALHDGYTDVIYVLLPVWQAEFALSYGLLALLRGLYAGAMAGLQIPVGRIAERIDGKVILIAGTALSALGYAFAGFSGGVIGLGLALALSGAGSSTQHPIASAAVSRAYGTAARGPLGIYNFSGDLGKAAIPALTSILLVIMSWRHTLLVLALAGLLVAVCIALWMPSVGKGAEHKAASASRGASTGRGFHWLLAIGILDTAVRMGFLTFLPFLLRDKGASLPTNGLALALVFIGGAAGKFTCGWLGARVGTLRTVLITEGGTAALIVAVLALPLAPAIVLLPLLGVMLNGTSSVLYGTVPELTPAHQTERAFALFYTGTIGSGAIAPVLYGLLGDALGPTLATAATALTALAICPLAVALARHLADDPKAA
ncbi:MULTISPECIES: MFS transporter [Bradyrhizobium]|uniref:MFS transporter n=1 Tax=Bradyrhizobium elkanii TaxID=29448 RepID=UPI002714F6B2|nr:MFS transporter [Bradyrhizobium elkanii]WLA48353.1 MFS transporter [Bradyrhizobium elkanii]WLB81442.1 MFS transporter [Bradyrhizobium elkanii]